MSSERKRLFDSQKERIEMLSIAAGKRRGDEPFVILVLDLRDDFAKNIAMTKTTEAEINQQVTLSRSKSVLPCLIFDTSENDAGVYFEHTKNWHLMQSLVDPKLIRVAIVGDGGVTFATHKIPE